MKPCFSADERLNQSSDFLLGVQPNICALPIEGNIGRQDPVSLMEMDLAAVFNPNHFTFAFFEPRDFFLQFGDGLLLFLNDLGQYGYDIH